LENRQILYTGLAENATVNVSLPIMLAYSAIFPSKSTASQKIMAEKWLPCQ